MPSKPTKRASLKTPTRVILTGIRSAFIGPNLTLATYRTATATIVIGIDADITLNTFEEPGGHTNTAPLSLITPGSLCELQTQGNIAVLFCDALSDDYTEIDMRDIGDKIAKLRALLSQGPKEQTPASYLNQAFELLGVTSEQSVRPDIARVVAAINREPHSFSNIDSAAQLAGLSTTRFQHAFTETLGIPFRRYRQWRRMGQVIRSLAAGETLTQAAYAAGFSNSAHLSTAFKSMFGLRPSDLIANQAEYYLSDL